MPQVPKMSFNISTQKMLDRFLDEKISVHHCASRYDHKASI